MNLNCRHLPFALGLALTACAGGQPAALTPDPTTVTHPARVVETNTPKPSRPAATPTGTGAVTAPQPTAPQPTASPSGPGAVTAPRPTAPPATAPLAEVDYAPTQSSIWEAPAAPDVMTGQCASGPLVLPYGLVALIPGENILTLRDQGGGEYTLQRVRMNVYAYVGRSVLLAANVSMDLRFTSQTAWVMQTVTVLDSDPACQHTHNYSAEFRWFTR